MPPAVARINLELEIVRQLKNEIHGIKLDDNRCDDKVDIIPLLCKLPNAEYSINHQSVSHSCQNFGGH